MSSELERTTNLWRGQFGNAYHERSPGSVFNNIRFFERALRRMQRNAVGFRAIEFGAGIGSNLVALHHLHPSWDLTAVELNESAFNAIPYPEIVTKKHLCSMFDCHDIGPYELVVTKGLLIHITPQHLPQAYEVIFNMSSQYILLAEYYSPRRQEISYRQEMGVLWKGPYAEEMISQYPGKLQVLDYGFVWKHDAFPQDDITWWLMEKML